MLGFGRARRSWFKVSRYKDFFLPYECHGMVFLKERIAVLCAKGFEIMDLSNLKGIMIPEKYPTTSGTLLGKMRASCRPMELFRTGENELLLCYDGAFASSVWTSCRVDADHLVI